MQGSNALNPNYKRQALTGGFFKDYGAAPAEFESPGSKELFEPSPLVSGGGNYAYATLTINLILHLACAICTCVAAAMYLPPPNDKANVDYSVYHDTDFVKSWVIVMLVCEILCVVFTVLYYGLVFKAMAFALPAQIGLSLQLIATVSAIKLSYWVCMAPDTAKSMRDANGDGWIVATMYLGLIVIAGYIMTPISGTYYKVVSAGGAEAWAKPKEAPM